MLIGIVAERLDSGERLRTGLESAGYKVYGILDLEREFLYLDDDDLQVVIIIKRPISLTDVGDYIIIVKNPENRRLGKVMWSDSIGRGYHPEVVLNDLRHLLATD